MLIIGPDAVKAMLIEPFTEAEKAFRAKSLSEQVREVAAYRRPGDPVPPSQQVRAELASDQARRWRIFARDGYTCQHCRATGATVELTVDHVFPVSLGGTNAESNLQTLCRSCNSRKGATAAFTAASARAAVGQVQNVSEETALQPRDVEDPRIAVEKIEADNAAYVASCRRRVADPETPPEVRRQAAGAVAGYDAWAAHQAHSAAMKQGDIPTASAAARDIAAAYDALDAACAVAEADETAR
jgi:hypothetical protein